MSKDYLRLTTADILEKCYRIQRGTQRILCIVDKRLPGLYPKSTEYFLRIAYSEHGSKTPRCVNRADFIATDFPQVDTVIILPNQPYLGSQDPAPENIL